jgi:hypothetical protein
MFLGEDFIIEEPIPDLLAWMKVKKLVCASNLLHLDCGICGYDVQAAIKLIDEFHTDYKIGFGLVKQLMDARLCCE